MLSLTSILNNFGLFSSVILIYVVIIHLLNYLFQYAYSEHSKG